MTIVDDAELVWSPDKHCPSLDGVRGFAILVVTLYRLCKELDPTSHPIIATIRRIAPIGERGVDLFFVLSGFLITGILLRSKGKINYFRNFIVRRSLRIFPLYFLSLTIGLLLIPNLVKTSVFELPLNEQLYLWTYTSNLRMSWQNEWCFGPFDHFWSLAVEEHFYFIWPAVVLLLTSKRLGWFCALIIAAVMVIRTAAATNENWNVAIDVLTLFRADALCMGAMLAVLMQSNARHNQIRRFATVTVILLLPILIAIVFMGKRLLGIPNSLYPLLFMAGLAIVLLSPKPSILSVLFETSALRFLGKYSYGMYVFQLPLITVLPHSNIAAHLPSNPIASGVIYVIAMFGLITTAALLSFHLFESHFLRYKKRFH